MNTIKSLGLAGLAVAGLFSAQAFATPCPAGTEGSPTCISTAPGSLQNTVDSLTSSGHIDVYNDQYTPSSYWQIGATGGSENTLVLQFAGNTNVLSYGIYDPSDTTHTNKLELFNGSNPVGTQATLVYKGNGLFKAALFGEPATSATFGDGALFGYYLTTDNGTFYSDASWNAPGGNTYPNGAPQMVAYQGNSNGNVYLDINGNSGKFLTNEFLLAWDGNIWTQSDLNYNDFVVLAESVHSVPEPAELGMFGFGVLLIGGFVALRRRSVKA